MLNLLATLPVKGRAPSTGYSRENFGQTWSDDVEVDGGHNGCDTRNDILRRDLLGAQIKDGTQGCVVLSGTLLDQYTGQSNDFTRGANSDAVQIDHLVSLSDAWATGAQQLTAEQRQNLANDPLNLQAVAGEVNQSKGAGDAGDLAAAEQGLPLHVRFASGRGQGEVPAMGEAGRTRCDRPGTRHLRADQQLDRIVDHTHRFGTTDRGINGSVGHFGVAG